MSRAGKALCLLLAGALLASAAGAAVTVTADRSRMTEDDAFTLVIRADAGEDLKGADLSPLQRDFNILGTSQSSHHSYVNGRSESYKELQVTLEPRRTGQLQVPPLTVDGTRTQALAIQVGAGSTGLDASEDVFVEADVDRSSVYVQSQLIYRFRIYQAMQLEERRRTPLEIPGATVEELPLQTWQRKVDGRNYLVTEIRYAIFPENSGTLLIPSITFTAREPGRTRSLFDRGRPVQRRAADIQVEVLPVPDGYPDAPWLPAEALAIAEDWSIPPDQMAVGDSSTRTVTLRARGLLGPQLPPVEVPVIEGIKLYPDRPRAEHSLDENGVSALGINSAAWVVTRDGHYDIPAVRIPWWNVTTDSLEYVELPARSFDVDPAPVAETPPAAVIAPLPVAETPQVITADATPWRWATAAALIGWILTIAWFMRRPVVARHTRASAENEQTESRHFKTLLHACSEGPALQVREHLRAWAASYFDLPGKPSLRDIGQRIGDPDIQQQLEELERSLYGDSGAPDWGGDRLGQALKAWRQHKQRRAASDRAAELPPLYRQQPT